jgi:hypothetical protein
MVPGTASILNISLRSNELGFGDNTHNIHGNQRFLIAFVDAQLLRSIKSVIIATFGKQYSSLAHCIWYFA